jgi:hypothetical protein
MPTPDPTDASDYVLLHRDTGSALYTTRATEGEIQRANANLQQAGQRSRFLISNKTPQGPGNATNVRL